MTKFGGIVASLAAIAVLATAAGAQATGSITGQVIEQESREPIPGAQVYLPGLNTGTLTNQLGRYTITNVPAGSYDVRVRLIGYTQRNEQVTVPAGGTAEVDFVLVRSAIELNPVVVNAITGQEQRTRELGTNVGNISVEDIPAAQVTKVADVLTARTAGVTLQGVAGTTGTSQRIRIRGANSVSLNNDPLVYVDGVLVSSGTGGAFGVGGQEPTRLNDISPEDIESIEVLKGPAASALYGTAAANGVVLISTKRGRVGSARWNAFYEAGELSDETDYPINVVAFDRTDPTAPFIRNGFINYRRTTNPTGFVACLNYQLAAGTCAQDTIVRFNTLTNPLTTPFQEGFRTKYGVSVAGGTEQVTYYVSGDVEDEQGVIDYNNLDKYNLRANMQAQVSPKLTLNVNTNYVRSELTLNNNDNSIFSPLINGLVGSAVFFPPPEGEQYTSLNYGFGFSPSDLANIPTFLDVDRFVLGGSATYRPLEWLSGNLNLGLDLVDRHAAETLQPERLPIAAQYTIGYRASERGNEYTYTGNASLSAQFGDVEQLRSTTTLGGSYLRDRSENTYCYGSGIVEGTASCGATSAFFEVDEDFAEIITVGGFLRQEVGWRDRVFVAASVRGDDNSAFGRDFGFILYPSASLSWVVSSEEFFPRTQYLTDFRIRAAYGESGLRPGFRDAVTLFDPIAVTVGGEDVTGITPSRTGNVLLEPERTREYEAGFDLGLFEDRLAMDLTYYYKRSEDALISRPLPPSLGLTGNIWENLGAVKNSGFELELQALAFEMENARLDVRFNATTLDNELLDLGTLPTGEPIQPINFNRGNQRHVEGYPLGGFWGRPVTFADANDDGLLATSEVTVGDTAVYLGPSLPTNTQTLSLDLQLFRYIRLNTLFDRRAGHKQLDYTSYFRCRFGLLVRNSYPSGCPAVYDANAPLYDQAAFLAANVVSGNRSQALYVQDADFIKWREVSITLTAPTEWTRGWNALEGVSLTLAGRNLATWTDYRGLDPEINESGGNTNFTQGEFNTQPPIRYFTARLNLSF